MVKLAWLFPGAIETVEGTVASELELDRDMTYPAGPALPFKVTVPVVEAPPPTVAGFKVTWAREAGVTVTVTFWEELPRVARICAVVFEPTPDVFTVNVAVVNSSTTKIDAGTVTALLSLDKETLTPKGPGPHASVTVPVDVFPPTSDAGLNVNEVMGGGGGGVIVRFAVLEI